MSYYLTITRKVLIFTRKDQDLLIMRKHLVIPRSGYRSYKKSYSSLVINL